MKDFLEETLRQSVLRNPVIARYELVENTQLENLAVCRMRGFLL